MATMSIRLSDDDKVRADVLFKALGLTTNAAINMFIKQCIRTQGLPFIPTLIPTNELKQALKEAEDIENGKVEAKGYNNMYKMLEDLKK